MAEYIEREALIEAARHNVPISRCEADIVDIKELIESIPAADVRPERHGHWAICSDGYYPYCSECKEEPKNGVMSDFCPKCGAKMDGKNGESDG